MSPVVIPTGATPTVSDFAGRVRADLFDAGQRAGEQPRWLDSDLTRALDRANDKYSSVAPYLRQLLVPTVAGSRRYAVPADCWYVDRIEYPYGEWPAWFQPFQELLSPLISHPPVGAGSVSFSSGGALSAGTYSWYVTFTTPGEGETEPSLLVTSGPSAGAQANLDGIPSGPYGVTGRNLYRTAAGGATATLLAVIADNTTTRWVDADSDASIAEALMVPMVNSTQGKSCVDLQIDDSKLPNASNAGGLDPHWGWAGMRYAAKHELDSNGTSIPERHWDLLCLGAAMFAIMAYLVPTADNFEYVDGQFRDRVDDTKAPIAWLALGQDMEQRFEKRLAEVKLEGETGVTAMASWGDKPIRWDRL